MNKQQLANKIWESANKMRSKIDASEYKDYILGFMFYKFLSDTELKFLNDKGYTHEDIKALDHDDQESIKFIQNNIGYFIAYEDLFSTWVSKGSDFDVSDVRDALSAFERLINKSHKKVFERIFNTLETGLNKLGGSALEQTKAIRDLIQLLKIIPMNGKQDYDVLGFIYENLISNFAVNAGKKAGEFYTPHEVSLLMSEIIADHLKHKDEIKIYDPTSGSGSLLINIGHALSKHMTATNKIKYYAQELKENTYNLTRMNLVMRGILPDNIYTRNADTLENDWPYFDESDPQGTYDPLYVDAVVSNPPYSQKWDREHKDADARYKDFGLAPKSKADYAFLLHDLFHVKSDGIMTIVLPHGVLFRGGEEGQIRKNLIEKNHIDAIIGLPANIFYGTGIPTIIMVLKKAAKKDRDILIVDASKGFIKVGNKNELKASDIKKITDAVIHRTNIESFSRLVSIDEIRNNDYNLNIPRYVDSAEPSETWDLYSIMFGGIPKDELDILNPFWESFPSLKSELFEEVNTNYVKLKTNDFKDVIQNNKDIKTYIQSFNTAFDDFDTFMNNRLIKQMMTLSIRKEEELISEEIFKRIKPFTLLDKYKAYQALEDEWKKTSIDLEIIQSEGFDAVRIVDPNMVIKKKDNKEVEVQDGWVGRIIPFSIVQESLMTDSMKYIHFRENRLSFISDEISEIIENIDTELKDNLLNDDNSAFEKSKLKEELSGILKDVFTDEILVLNKYIELVNNKVKKDEKIKFINFNSHIKWKNIEPNKDGTFGKKNVENFIKTLRLKFEFEENSHENLIKKSYNLLEEEKLIKKELKVASTKLIEDTKSNIERLTDTEALQLIEIKWIHPIIQAIEALPQEIIQTLNQKVKYLSNKYQTTFAEVDKELEHTQQALTSMLDELEGDAFDLKGLQELKALIDGE